MFCDDNWTPNDRLQLWTDASDYGIGCVFQNMYISEKFSDSQKKLPIAWRELYAILCACVTWGHHLICKRVLFHCDNNVVVQCLCSGVSRNTELMTLLRKLFYICACFNFECSAVYIPSKANVLADALSRGNQSKFLSNCNTKMYKCAADDISNDLYNYR